MTKKTQNRFSPEVRQRAVRMVLDHGGDHTSQLDFGHSGGVAEGISDALPEGWR